MTNWLFLKALNQCQNGLGAEPSMFILVEEEQVASETHVNLNLSSIDVRCVNDLH